MSGTPSVGGDRDLGGEVAGEDVGRRLAVGPLDLDLHVEPTGAQDRRVDEVLPVGGADHDHVAQPLDAVDLGEQLGHDRRFHVGRDPRAAGAEHRVHLVEEHDDRPTLLALLPRPLEHETDLALGLAHVLVEQLGSLDVDEVAAALLVAGLRRHLLGEAVGDGLGDQRLATTRRAVEQDPLRRWEAVLGEQLLVQEGQLDGVGDLLDLLVEAADVGVGDVGHLLEQQVLDLRPRQLLEQQVRPCVEPHRVARTQVHAADRVSQLADALLVGVADDERPHAVLEHLLDLTTSPVPSGSRAEITLKLSLSTTSEPRSSVSCSISGWRATRILRPLVSTSTVPSSFLPTTTPYADGGWVSLSTSSRSEAMWSRASRNV